MPKESYKPEIKQEFEQQLYYMEDATPLTYEEVQQLKLRREKKLMDKIGMTAEEWRAAKETEDQEYARLAHLAEEEFLKREILTEDNIKERFEKSWHAWQDIESQQQRKKFGPYFILRNDPNLYWHIRLSKNGEFEKYISPAMREAWYQSQEISQMSGIILQYAVESVLKLAGNRNLIIEKSFQRKRPDLVRINSEKQMFIDIKLSSRTSSILKDIKNYSKIISELNPGGGYLIFLTLNGEKLPNEEIEIAESKIKIKYFLVEDFMRRLANNNKHLLKFLTGKDEELSEEKTNKIKEILSALRNLKDSIRRNTFSDRSDTQQEVLEKYKTMRLQMKKLARESDIEEIVNTDFAALLDF